MNHTGTSLRLKLVALGVAAALTSTAALSQANRDPSPIETDRAAIPSDDSLEQDRERAAQQRDEELGQEQRQAGQQSQQQPGQQSQRQAGQQDRPQPGQQDQRQAGQQQPGQQGQRQAGQQQGEQEDRDLQASQRAGATDAGETFNMLSDEHDNLGTFVEAVRAAGLEDSLTDGTEYTVFAPTDEAFEEALESMGKTKEELLGADNREELISLLRAHIVADDVDSEMARNLEEARTIDGGTIDLSSEGEELMVGDASVVESDIQEGSLRVYVIDQVLESNAPARAAEASQQQDREQGQQPAAAARAQGEQPSAAVREQENELSARDAEDDEDETEPRLN